MGWVVFIQENVFEKNEPAFILDFMGYPEYDFQK